MKIKKCWVKLLIKKSKCIMIPCGSVILELSWIEAARASDYHQGALG